MIKSTRPKRIALPIGRTFVAQYRRTRRDELTKNVILRRMYKQRPAPKSKRQLRKGRGIGSTLKKILKNPLLKQLGRKALKRALGVYQNLLKKAKYKKLPKILDSNLASSLVKKVHNMVLISFNNIFCRKKLLKKTAVKL